MAKKLAYNSSRYHTLCYAKMVDRPFSRADIKGCLAGCWARGGVADLNRGLDFLTKAGYLVRFSRDNVSYMTDMWQITELGIDAIFDTARRSTHKRVQMEDDFDMEMLLAIRD